MNLILFGVAMFLFGGVVGAYIAGEWWIRSLEKEIKKYEDKN